MIRYLFLIIGCLGLLAGSIYPQEVVIADFPVGVGGSIGPEFFKPHHDKLQALADTLGKYPMAQAIITGGADGLEFRENHDAHNPALALGRAHLLRGYLIEEFKIDSTRLFVQSEEVKEIGPDYRYVSIRIDRGLADIDTRLAAMEHQPPVERHFTEVKEVSRELSEALGLQLSLGVSSSPFGGIPIATGAVTWKRVLYIEGLVGHTFWNNSFRFQNVDLDTKRRMIGGYMIYYPWENLPVGLLGGWMRVEEISQDYYEYVRLSDGPMLGIRVAPLKFLLVTGSYNPSRHRISSESKSDAKNGQFSISAAAYIIFGGKSEK